MSSKKFKVSSLPLMTSMVKISEGNFWVLRPPERLALRAEEGRQGQGQRSCQEHTGADMMGQGRGTPEAEVAPKCPS